MARAASETPQRGVCATTSIRLTLSLGHDPVEMHNRRVIKAWLSRVACNSAFQARLNRHWQASFDKIRRGRAW
eukprot:7168180-Pyramimonas_sp.AAC.1